MKSSLRAQISDFFAGRNGLASHTTYRFYQPWSAVKAEIRRIFVAANRVLSGLARRALALSSRRP